MAPVIYYDYTVTEKGKVIDSREFARREAIDLALRRLQPGQQITISKR